MMKNLSLWQKAGLATLVALPLALGLGFNFKNNSGLESKILPRISMSTAEAKTIEGYEVPDLTGYTKIKEGYLDLDRTKDGIKETFVEIFKGSNDYIMRYTTKDKTWALAKLKSSKDPRRYAVVDTNCDGEFDAINLGKKPMYLPKCLK